MFEWDEAKNLANIRKHGIPFEYACDVFKGPIWVSEDTRKAYGEPRWRAIGELLGSVVAVAYTKRGSRIRIISARKASRNERKAYQAHRNSLA